MGRTKGSTNKPKDPNAPKKPRKARAAKAPEAPKTAQRPASSQSSVNAKFKRPNPDDLIKLVKQVCSRASDQKVKGMESKKLIDELAETKGLDRPAFGIFKKLWKMAQDAPDKLSVTLPHLLSYIDDGGLPSIADGARGLAINGEDDDGDQVDLEDAIADAPDEQPATGASPRLSIVPGSNAPTVPDADVPSAPRNEDAA